MKVDIEKTAEGAMIFRRRREFVVERRANGSMLFRRKDEIDAENDNDGHWEEQEVSGGEMAKTAPHPS